MEPVYEETLDTEGIRQFFFLKKTQQTDSFAFGDRRQIFTPKSTS